MQFIFILLILPILNALGRPYSYMKRSTDLHDLQELFEEQPPHCSRATVSIAAPSICESFMGLHRYLLC